MKIKNPKKIAAALLIIYIISSLALILNDLSMKHVVSQKDITGYSAAGTIRVKLAIPCTIEVKEGYNLISICKELRNNSILSALEPISGKYGFVLKWSSLNQEFVMFSPDSANNSFDVFETNESYFLFMKENGTLSMFGLDAGNLTVELAQEFNSVGYPYLFSADVKKYVSPFEEDVLVILTWNNSAQEFIALSPKSADPAFKTINKGEGQFIFLNVPNATLRYNTTELKS
jgi:hypothetical protein